MAAPHLCPARRAMLLRIGGAAALLAVARFANAAPAPTMTLHTRPIPSSGEPLPVIGLGTWQSFDVGTDTAARAPLAEVLRLFVAAGGRVIDSSPMYGRAEAVVGDLVAQAGLREKLFLATKVWTSGRSDGIEEMNRSLARLRATTIGLMQVHNLVDVATHAMTLADWKRAGRIRHAGITHYTSSAYAEVERQLRAHPWDTLQINYSLAEPESAERLLPLALERGIAVVVNRPFAGGGLFRRVRGTPLPAWASELGIASWAQYFLKWILGHPAVTCAIPGTRRPEHLRDNLAAGTGALPDAALRRRMAEHVATL
ncbi:MAG: aldo/keto reductase [Proteobacteria bacterium]|nr:aldo/keto reductase [Pseudomonadota bacterium]